MKIGVWIITWYDYLNTLKQTKVVRWECETEERVKIIEMQLAPYEAVAYSKLY